jgi:hypothetical protein
MDKIQESELQEPEMEKLNEISNNFDICENAIRQYVAHLGDVDYDVLFSDTAPQRDLFFKSGAKTWKLTFGLVEKMHLLSQYDEALAKSMAHVLNQAQLVYQCVLKTINFEKIKRPEFLRDTFLIIDPHTNAMAFNKNDLGVSIRIRDECDKRLGFNLVECESV